MCWVSVFQLEQIRLPAKKIPEGERPVKHMSQGLRRSHGFRLPFPQCAYNTHLNLPIECTANYFLNYIDGTKAAEV